MIVCAKMEQGSEQWLETRKGRATASEAKNILTPTGKPSTSATGYMRKLARESVVEDPMVFMGNKFTEWGNEKESEAREVFEAVTGLEVAEVGFCNRADNAPIGCSPDGLISNIVGEYIAGLEIKCPQVDKHVEYLMDGVLPAEYKMQVHWSLATTGLNSWYFMSYFPGLKEFIIEVKADDFTRKVKDAQDEFVIRYVEVRKEVLGKITLTKEEKKLRGIEEVGA